MPKIVSAGLKTYAQDGMSLTASGFLSYTLPVVPLGPVVGHYIAPREHRIVVDVVNLAVWLDAFLGQFVPGGIIR